jgi:hypothetical protein
MFTEDSPAGIAIRRAWQMVSKGISDERMVGPPDEDERDDEGDEDQDALSEIERLATEERRENPQLSKAQSFTKAYLDNPALAQRERTQSRRRLGIAV